ncbi:conserved Plasmodium protein, unknown function [Plasmodium vivax]|uniref:Uncharacterized protein n=6 Tax=Plasmodium vivax TaxID=5855 RepID=A5K6Y9_PLAVS|nr:hypothetical protein, conserved [Plasmodium vivax]KMZ81102.1 hypothetical protein PVIIG_02584 [Plasmodium vivax India VII]KMZ87485.1 hypothetical protein PVBG_04194 [Plasmodium vivax Brazil I]KMZ93776.1 hypothetical protein PVMG_05029 [Plasmodium vivax Mauritania I]KNA00476.1 hypothetical protein PVNG_01110 [Plasmodium vivax North Korean]EDL45080.1 hypothetical protein, conserved [Plasmodium vivax]|eukprot:XP_001614807.1 hypothetical protein [Plasmodium vivax Sal-1]
MSTHIERLQSEDEVAFKLKGEIAAIEKEIKSWFIKRRLNMELNYSLHNLFTNYNIVGLSINKKIDLKEKMLWHDIVNGKPTLEDTLSLDAKEYKADVYRKMWENSTTTDNPCRLVGSIFFRCLKGNYQLTEQEREGTCMHSFLNFTHCRKALKLQQANNIRTALTKQSAEDTQAKALFERRSALLGKLTGSAP